MFWSVSLGTVHQSKRPCTKGISLTGPLQCWRCGYRPMPVFTSTPATLRIMVEAHVGAVPTLAFLCQPLSCGLLDQPYCLVHRQLRHVWQSLLHQGCHCFLAWRASVMAGTLCAHGFEVTSACLIPCALRGSTWRP